METIKPGVKENGFPQIDGVRTLPDWKKIKNPFENIAGLNIDSEYKDVIILWWKENPRVIKKLAELKQVAFSVNLPKNEASEVTEVYGTALTHFIAANNSLLTFIGQSDGNALQKVVELYTSAVGLSHKESDARKVLQAIKEFKSGQEEMELTTAVAKAIIETRSANPADSMFRIKAAQYVFQEMFDQMTIGRIISVNDIDGETTGIIDSPKTEQIDLTTVFLGKPWTGEERKKMLRNYNKLKRVLNNLGADTDYKIGLNTLWRWANGKLPKVTSVFEILHYADDLNEGITDAVGDSWQAEADRLEDAEDV